MPKSATRVRPSKPEADAALIAEAETLAKLSHPNVVTVYGVSEWEGGVFFDELDAIAGEDDDDVSEP